MRLSLNMPFHLALKSALTANAVSAAEHTVRVNLLLNGQESGVVRSPLDTLKVFINGVLLVVVHCAAKRVRQASADSFDTGILRSRYAVPRTKNATRGVRCGAW